MVHPRHGGRGPTELVDEIICAFGRRYSARGTGEGLGADLRTPIRKCHHARLSGVDLPREKRMEIALTYIYGIGRTRSKEILDATGVSPDLRSKDLSDEDLAKLREYIEESLKVEGDLRREVQADIRRKIEIGCYQGLRHRRGLPVRGQRTKTNARTVRVRSAPCRQEEGEVMPPKSRSTGPKKTQKTRRRDKKNIPHGAAHIKSTFNNTIVSITDPAGNVISWASSGHVASRVRVSRLPSPLSLLLRALPVRRRSTVSRRLTSSSRDRDPVARPQSVPSRLLASRSAPFPM